MFAAGQISAAELVSIKLSILPARFSDDCAPSEDRVCLVAGSLSFQPAAVMRRAQLLARSRRRPFRSWQVRAMGAAPVESQQTPAAPVRNQHTPAAPVPRPTTVETTQAVVRRPRSDLAVACRQQIPRVHARAP